MANNSEILTIKEPSIVLDNIMVGNYKDPNQSVADKVKTMGASSPTIKINTYLVDASSITKFKIDTSGFVPTLSLAFKDITKQFEGDFPKDGDLIEVYIRSRNNKDFKKIRVDFDIKTINSKSVSSTKIYSLSGIMRVPNLFSENQISYPSETSFNHLINTCDEIELGFASNETSTEDAMNRFNANNTIKEFIEKTTETSYKDEISFFTSFIDIYYYLNLVNVNSVFTLNEEIETGKIDKMTALVQDKNNEEESEEGKMVFTNHPSYESTTNYITNYSMFNNAGDIWMSNGYKRYSQFMNMDTTEFNSFFVDPLTTEGAEDKFVLLKGKGQDESYKKQNKYKYLGRMYSTENDGNLHPNYHFAKILNHQNNSELNKMGISITLNGISSNIQKYQRVPVAIFEYNTGLINKMSMKSGDTERGTEAEQSSDVYSKDESILTNEFLSGFYVVRDFSINWEPIKGFFQIVNLIRREWPIPSSAGIAKSKK